jgi:MFS family permease
MPLSLVLMGIAGWGLIAMASTTNMIVQLSVPDVLRGRVMSVYTTVFAGTTPIGGLFAGGVAATAGVAVALVLGGILDIAATVVGAIWVARHDRLSMSAEPGLRPLDARQGTGR